MGAKGPVPDLVDSSIWGGESTPVDLDLKNPEERKWAWVASWSLNANCYNVGGVIVVHKCFGSGISLSGELVPDINNFEKLKVFEF